VRNAGLKSISRRNQILQKPLCARCKDVEKVSAAKQRTNWVIAITLAIIGIAPIIGIVLMIIFNDVPYIGVIVEIAIGLAAFIYGLHCKET